MRIKRNLLWCIAGILVLTFSSAQAQLSEDELELWDFTLKNMDKKDPIKDLAKKDPLNNLAIDMKRVSRDLESRNTGQPVQVIQKDIVRQIDDLIEAMKKECSSCSGSGAGAASAAPSRPAAKSVIMQGPGGQGDLLRAQEGRKTWATLPDAEREKIKQSLSEGFPPGYEVILERYFKSLADETDPAELVLPGTFE